MANFGGIETILLVGAQKGYLIQSLQDSLRTVVDSIYIVSSIADVSNITQSVSTVIFYCDEQLVADKQLLIYIRDKMTDENISCFMVGAEQCIKEAGQIIYDNLVLRRYYRPINVKEVAKDVQEFLEENNRVVRKRILAVDDSPMMLASIRGWLSENYDVQIADSGLNAIKALAINRPDLILLDYEMPICDGRLTMEMIRAENEFADIPIIFLTGKSDKESIVKVMELKPDGYLLKTTRPADVRRFIDNFFVNQAKKNMKR